jgi:integrase
MDLIKTKGGEPRTVPLHEHLLAQGFLEFVRERGPGPLFYDPARSTNNKTAPWELRAGYLARWVRKSCGLSDFNVDPNHAWRHTFKTIALEVGIPERISDALTGHKATKVARQYEAPSVRMMAKSLARFPRYACV